MRTLPTLPLLALTSLVLAAGCGEVAVQGDPQNIGSGRATLRRSRDCNELVADLRADVVAKINKQIDSMADAVRDCRTALGPDQAMCNYYLGGGGYATDGSDFTPPRSAGEADNGASGAPTAGGQESGEKPAYSDTNTQVAGVDEADIVKTDGQRLFVLHGNTFRVMQAYPMDSLAELSVTTIEGTPSEMYVENGLVVIFSQVDGAPVYAAAGVPAPNQGQSGGEAPIAPGGDYRGSYGYYSQPLTKITVLRLEANSATSVAKETYLEGSYLSSRRVGTQVRTVLSGSGAYEMTGELIEEAGSGIEMQPETDVLAALETVRSKAIAKANQIPLERWLPRTFDKQGDAVTSAPLLCSNAYTPSVGTTEGGLTEVSTLDLGNLAADTQEIAIFGQAGTVYGNEGTLYIAAGAYTDMPWGGGWANGGPSVEASEGSSPSAGDTTSPAPTPQNGNVGLLDTARKTIARPELPDVISLTKTHLHKFTFSAEGTPVYESSGTIAGEVQNQFSLDERNGVLRVATTERRAFRSDYEGNGGSDERPRMLSHVFALQSQGGELGELGAVRDLAPGERIYSVRFVGARAYVVTFKQVDPLFVLDFANPAAPALLGELTIPGFSNYMHPLDDNHLLTIGQEADESGRVQGLALQIFDVSQPTAPQRTQKFVYSADYGSSEASYNHKAFTYFADKGLLAFPYTSYDSNTGVQHSTLELFRVSTEAGFDRIGGIDHSGFFTQPQSACTWVDPTVRRGLFIENVAYSVSYGGIIAKNVNDLGAAGASVALPNPYGSEPNDCGGGVGGGEEVAPGQPSEAGPR